MKKLLILSLSLFSLNILCVELYVKIGDGEYAQVNQNHSDLTGGRIIPRCASTAPGPYWLGDYKTNTKPSMRPGAAGPHCTLDFYPGEEASIHFLRQLLGNNYKVSCYDLGSNPVSQNALLKFNLNKTQQVCYVTYKESFELDKIRQSVNLGNQTFNPQKQYQVSFSEYDEAAVAQESDLLSFKLLDSNGKAYIFNVSEKLTL